MVVVYVKQFYRFDWKNEDPEESKAAVMEIWFVWTFRVTDRGIRGPDGGTENSFLDFSECSPGFLFYMSLGFGEFVGTNSGRDKNASRRSRKE